MLAFAPLIYKFMSNIIKDSEVGVSESSDSSVSAVSSKLDNYSSGERSVMARFISGEFLIELWLF